YEYYHSYSPALKNMNWINLSNNYNALVIDERTDRLKYGMEEWMVYNGFEIWDCAEVNEKEYKILFDTREMYWGVIPSESAKKDGGLFRKKKTGNLNEILLDADADYTDYALIGNKEFM